MANEAILIVETHLPVMMTVADGVGIAKGAILKMTDPFTASLADGDNDIVAGIAAREKIANDGNTKLAVFRGGIFRVLSGTASILIGSPLDTQGASGANEIGVAGINAQNIIGVSLEAAADADTFLMELRPTSMKLA